MADRSVSPARPGVGVPKTSQILSEAVSVATGGAATKGRPGQVRLTRDIAHAMSNDPHGCSCGECSDCANTGHLVGEGPVGIGKSLSYLSAAAHRALLGERTVISTAGLDLQRQLLDKDLPTVVEAVENLGGRTLRFGVLKGWSNYVCAQQVAETVRRAEKALQTGTSHGTPKKVDEMARRAARLVPDPDRPMEGREGWSEPIETVDLVPLLKWAVNQIIKDGDGDRHDYAGDTVESLWSEVSTDKDGCLGDECPFFAACAPRRVQDRLAEADMIVTNHTLVAIQAAKDAPVVTGREKIGVVDHMVIDEAHALAAEVRSRGSESLSPQALVSVGRRVGKHLAANLKESSKAATVEELTRDNAEAHAETLSAALNRAGALVQDQVDENGALPKETADEIAAWTTSLSRSVSGTAPRTTDGEMNRRRLLKRLSALRDVIGEAVGPAVVGKARWIEADVQGRPVMKVAPVNVAGLLVSRVWNSPVYKVSDGDLDEPTVEWFPGQERWNVDVTQDPDQIPDGPLSYPLKSVVAVSGTAPLRLPVELGLRSKVRSYESPYESAYANSLLFVAPATTDLGVDAPTTSRGRLDSRSHAEWAAPQVVNLVVSNDGSALVLCATSSGVKLYADRLRAASGGRWAVHEQGTRQRSQLAADWKADRDSVLVGTRSFFTGLDAPGETCSLVVIDRLPRSPRNALDDARVAVLTDAGADRWSAMSSIYVSDAAVLVEQAAGRLVRSESDRGVVAFLDPRFATPAERKMNASSTDRKIVLEQGLGHFPTVSSDWAVVNAFLRRR